VIIDLEFGYNAATLSGVASLPKNQAQGKLKRTEESGGRDMCFLTCLSPGTDFFPGDYGDDKNP
jgi:hypothetical protein